MPTSEQPDEPQPSDSCAGFLFLRKIDKGCPNSDTRREG